MSVKLWFDRLLSRSIYSQLVLLLLALAAALALSYLMLSWSGAEWEAFCIEKDLNKWLLPLYLLIDSNALNNLYISGSGPGGAQHGWMLIASSITFLIGAFIFSGFIIGIITSTIDRRVKNYEEGNTFYLKSGHYVIMGYDEIVPSIINYIQDLDPDAYILILTSAEAPKIREKLRKWFPAARMEKFIINYGHRVSMDIFDHIHLEGAKEIFVAGNHNKSEHDAINVESMDAIYRYLESEKCRKGSCLPGRITCFFKDIDTYAAFKRADIFRKIEKLGIEFVPFNCRTGWATQVFVTRKYHDLDNPGTEYSYPSLYGAGISEDEDKYVHLLFVGTTNLAVAFAMEAANNLHFANGARIKTRITFIDRNMDVEKDEFITRNRHFFEVQPYLYRDLTLQGQGVSEEELRGEYVRIRGKATGFLDVEFEFIKGDIFSLPAQDLVRSWALEHGKSQYLSVFMALADQRQNFVMGMNMPDEVYDRKVNLFIRQDRSDNFVTDLRNHDLSRREELPPYSIVAETGECISEPREGRYAHIYPFGMNETAFCHDETALRRAKLINFLYDTGDYTNLTFLDEATLNCMPPQEIWTKAEEMWRKKPVAEKWSNLYNAYSIPVKLSTLRRMRGVSPDDASTDFNPLSNGEIEVIARIEHNRWNVEKLVMGYRTPELCEDKYAHPRDEGVLKSNKKHFIHHDIRPFETLDTVAEIDREMARCLPWILRLTDE